MEINGKGGGGGGGGIAFETPSGTVDGANVTFTVLHIPVYLTLGGAVLIENDGYTRSGLTLTMVVAPPPGSGAAFRSAYNT